jgi:hypothetical protein
MSVRCRANENAEQWAITCETMRKRAVTGACSLVKTCLHKRKSRCVTVRAHEACTTLRVPSSKIIVVTSCALPFVLVVLPVRATCGFEHGRL